GRRDRVGNGEAHGCPPLRAWCRLRLGNCNRVCKCIHVGPPLCFLTNSLLISLALAKQRLFGRVVTAAVLPASHRARLDNAHGRGRAHRSHNALKTEPRCGEKTPKLALGALLPPRRHDGIVKLLTILPSP